MCAAAPAVLALPDALLARGRDVAGACSTAGSVRGVRDDISRDDARASAPLR